MYTKNKSHMRLTHKMYEDWYRLQSLVNVWQVNISQSVFSLSLRIVYVVGTSVFS